eukprot:symbB.v1.2.022878.t1/scaffold2049.1/size91137/5
MLKPPALGQQLRPVPEKLIRPLGLVTTLWGTLLLNEPLKVQLGQQRVTSFVCGINSIASAGLAVLTLMAPQRTLLAALTLQVAGFAAWQARRQGASWPIHEGRLGKMIVADQMPKAQNANPKQSWKGWQLDGRRIERQLSRPQFCCDGRFTGAPPLGISEVDPLAEHHHKFAELGEVMGGEADVGTFAFGA